MFLKLSCNIDNTEINICMRNFITMIFVQYEHLVLYVSLCTRWYSSKIFQSKVTQQFLKDH